MLSTTVPFDLVIPLLGVHTAKIISDEDKDGCTKVCAAELFIVVKAWKQWKGPTLGKWLSRLCYVHRTDYCGTAENHAYKELMA